MKREMFILKLLRCIQKTVKNAFYKEAIKLRDRNKLYYQQILLIGIY